MPSLWDRLRPRPPRAPETRRAGSFVALHGVGRAAWSDRSLPAFVREGYRENPIVHRAARLIAEAVASVPLDVTPEDHPAAALLASPNPRETGATLIERLVLHLMVAGNAYLEVVSVEARPRELHLLRPDRVRLHCTAEGWPEAWLHEAGGRTQRFPVEDGVSPILHLALADPLDDHFGLPPLAAAARAVDVHNAATAWNKALLDNAARPSGALVYGVEGANLSDAQFERLKAELEASFQGAANAGRPLLLDGGLDWKPLSLSPKDMDFEALKATAAREIALAFGVPPLMLGLPGDNTHANYREANRAFWRLTVVPLVKRLAAGLGPWLAAHAGRPVTLVPDLDAVPGMEESRAALWEAAARADFLTVDEKRALLGYPPLGAPR